jgi:tetratricopeptide (TPR) repeat protein
MRMRMTRARLLSSRTGAALVLGLALTLLAGGDARAADVVARARLEPPQVRVGGTATLSIEFQGAQDVPAPTLADVDGLGLRYIGPATQVSIMNGRMTASITHRYAVTAAAAGRFAIGPITIPYQGTTLDAGTVTIRVLAAGTAAGANAPPTVPQGRQLRLALTAPKTTVYLHERLPLAVKLWVGDARISDLQYPQIPGDGFALEPFPEPTQRNERTAEGIFQTVELQTVLTPHRSGALTVGPATMAMNVVTAQRARDPFFGSLFGGRRQQVTLESTPLVLDVLPLPEAGRPASFAGGVGRFELDVTAAPLALGVGDPVTVTMAIRGQGNLEQVTAPSLAATDALRVYPVQQVKVEGTGTAATQARTFEQVVIPQTAGAVTLPALEFSYFDPDAGAYRTVTTAPIPLTVAARDVDLSRPQVVGAVPAPVAPEEKLGRDIVFIKDDPGTLVPVGHRLYRRPLFWLLQPLPLLAWLGVVFYDRRRRRLHGDAGYARFTRAGRAARHALAEAEAALRAGDATGFHDRIAGTLRDYLAAKLGVPPGAVTADTVAGRLDGRRIPADVAEEVRAVLVACEHVRFAPDAAAGDMPHILERATAIVRAVERERRLAPPVVGLVLASLLAAGSGWAAAPDHPVALFFRAGELYTAEHYAEAAATYERILALGLESGPLHFNIGNAYFKDGDLGRAVLGYERARRLIPRDPDLAANLAYARTLTEEDDDRSLAATLLVPLASRLSSDELLRGAALAYTILMVLLIALRLLPAVARPARLGAVAAAVTLLVFGSAGVYRVLTVDLPDWAVLVGGEERAVRFEPADTGTEHFRAKPGRVLRILAERNDWAQVARRDGKRGWVERAHLSPL